MARKGVSPPVIKVFETEWVKCETSEQTHSPYIPFATAFYAQERL